MVSTVDAPEAEECVDDEDDEDLIMTEPQVTVTPVEVSILPENPHPPHPLSNPTFPILQAQQHGRKEQMENFDGFQLFFKTMIPRLIAHHRLNAAQSQSKIQLFQLTVPHWQRLARQEKRNWQDHAVRLQAHQGLPRRYPGIVEVGKKRPYPVENPFTPQGCFQGQYPPISRSQPRTFLRLPNEQHHQEFVTPTYHRNVPPEPKKLKIDFQKIHEKNCVKRQSKRGRVETAMKPLPVMGAEEPFPPWNCRVCTLKNNLFIHMCEACKTPRPQEEWQPIVEDRRSKFILRRDKVIARQLTWFRRYRTWSKEAGKECVASVFNSSLIYSMKVPLRDPFSQEPILMPARGIDCQHISVFDLQSFLIRGNPFRIVKMSLEESLKLWTCPFCGKPCTMEQVYIDSFFIEIMDGMSQNLTEIWMKSDGTWDVKDEKAQEATVIDLTDPAFVIKPVVKIEKDA